MYIYSTYTGRRKVFGIGLADVAKGKACVVPGAPLCRGVWGHAPLENFWDIRLSASVFKAILRYPCVYV